MSEIWKEKFNNFEEKKKLRGNCYFVGDNEYENCNHNLFNHYFENLKPAFVIKPTGPSDVSLITKFALENNLGLVARSGGHSGSGRSAANEKNILVDLSAMQGVYVDREKETVLFIDTNIFQKIRVQTGCLLKDIDIETGLHGLAVPLGTYGGTGVGLCLHGGVGILTGQHGLTVDSILEVEIVTGNAEILIANKNQNSDLFWGVKGAANNFEFSSVFLNSVDSLSNGFTKFFSRFSIVTSILFKCVKPRKCTGGMMLQVLQDPFSFVRQFADLHLKRGQDFGGLIGLINPPNGPPTGLGTTIGAWYDESEIDKEDSQIKKFINSNPVHKPWLSNIEHWEANIDSMGMMSSGPPTRQYWRSMAIEECTDEFINVLIKSTQEIIWKDPIVANFTLVGFEYWDSVVKFTQEDHSFPPIAHFEVHTIWSWANDPSLDEKALASLETFWDTMRPFKAKNVTVGSNYRTDWDANDANGQNDAILRLEKLKAQYDSKNLFNGTLNTNKSGMKK